MDVDDKGRLGEAIRVSTDGTGPRVPRLAGGVGGMEISDVTFWLAFYALVVGALGDTYAVIMFVRWLRQRMKGPAAESKAGSA